MTRKNGKEWGLGKIFGAFQNPADCVSQLLQISHTSCSYHSCGSRMQSALQPGNRPGMWNKEQGRKKCKLATRERGQRVQSRWPEAQEECHQCLAYMIWNGSSMTDTGWKVSYHVLYQWLIFSYNSTMLKL
jgi:hypothetical protein